MSNKCIYKPKNNNEEPDSLISPCFEIGPDVELKDIPTNGEEYLLKVINERQNIPAVVRCDIDVSKLPNNQTYFVDQNSLKSAPDKLKPTIEWQNIQVADFSDIRMYVSSTRANNSYKVSRHVGFDLTDVSKWKRFFEDNEPTLSHVLKFHQSVLDHALEAIVEILDEVEPNNTIDHKMGQWIYSLMACLNLPLLSDSISTLRDLARKVAEIRSRIDPEDDNAPLAVAPLNIFICLVARYFRQYDLADERQSN